MRRTAAALVLATGLMLTGSSAALAAPWVPDIPTGPCPYAGCDDLDDWLDQHDVVQ